MRDFDNSDMRILHGLIYDPVQNSALDEVDRNIMVESRLQELIQGWDDARDDVFMMRQEMEDVSYALEGVRSERDDYEKVFNAVKKWYRDPTDSNLSNIKFTFEKIK